MELFPKFEGVVNMNTLETILTRRSTRSYSSAPVERDLNYKSQPPAQVEIIDGGDFRAKKLKLVDDGRTLIYNDSITIKNIPLRAYEYVVNGRNPLEWIIDRYLACCAVMFSFFIKLRMLLSK